MTIAKRQPVSSFGPQLLALLLKGSNEEVEVTLPSYTRARALMSRLHALRQAMRRENHPMAEAVSRARVSIKFGPDAGFPDTTKYKDSASVWHPHDRTQPAKLYVRPQDREFEAALTAAGVILEAPRMPDEAPRPEDIVEERGVAAPEDWIDRLLRDPGASLRTDGE